MSRVVRSESNMGATVQSSDRWLVVTMATEEAQSVSEACLALEHGGAVGVAVQDLVLGFLDPVSLAPRLKVHGLRAAHCQLHACMWGQLTASNTQGAL